jgi:hypothetical protein
MTQKSSSKSKKSSARTLSLVQESGVSTRPRVIKRRPGKGKSEPENIVMEDTSMEKEAIHQEEGTEIVTQTEPDLMVPSPVGAEEGESRSPADETKNSTPPSPVLPQITGFDLSGMGLSHQYSVRCSLVLCDCCVQKTPERIFDVLGRNFADTGSLMWWLRRIGKGHLAEPLKGKDVVDAVRKTAHGLSRELKEEIGRPVPRW